MTWWGEWWFKVQGLLVSQKKKSKNIFALDPQFLFYNIKVLYKIGYLQKKQSSKDSKFTKLQTFENIIQFLSLSSKKTQVRAYARTRVPLCTHLYTISKNK